MRPTSLVVEGFTTFRDLTEVDFDGADLFALTGPTGSGKSSVIDAIVFALYGCVPRLDRRAVAPVISLGRNEARVVLEFTVHGVPYTAARVVRRTKTGATTKEARLESQGEVLAGNERELTEAVEDLLGLTIDHFTTCVVLPQGEFMRLLHAKPAERQELLKSLLELRVYEQMARVARHRQNEATNQAEIAGVLLEKLADATPEAEAAVAERISALHRARERVDTVVPALADLRDAEADARRRAETARDEVARLQAVKPPQGLDHQQAEIADARSALAGAEAEAVARAAEHEAAEEALAAHPDRAVLERAKAAHEQRTKLVAEQEEVGAHLAEHEAAVKSAHGDATAARDALEAAAQALEGAQHEHRVADLAAGLVAGEPCPVCRQDVARPPAPAPPGAVEEAKAVRAAAGEAHDRAQAALHEAGRRHDRVVHRLESLRQQLAETDQLVADHPDPTAVAAALAARTEAEEAERSARDLARRARRAVDAARQAVAAVDERERAARVAFGKARDGVVALGPPSAALTDLASDWAELVEWAAAERPVRLEAAESAVAAADAAAAEARTLVQGVVRELTELDVVVRDHTDLRGPLAAAVAEATRDQRRIQEGMQDAATHRETIADARLRAGLAQELHRLLSANNFERWVLDEALAGLVDGATELLLELSAGAYSLALDERSNFWVVDHRNADERRPARTLSGGETFLASLALALALADQIAGLAAGGSARLESVFLDEGFGTLDPATLDTVAAAIEELGARGRMVGLISHVPELAERVPVRFEVQRGPAGSTVTKVVA